MLDEGHDPAGATAHRVFGGWRAREQHRDYTSGGIWKLSNPKLIFFDMEGTLFRKAVSPNDTGVDPSVWVAIARELGPNALEEEKVTQKKWRRGDYRSYVEWMQDTIAIHQKYGLSKSTFQEILDSIEFMPGVHEVFSELRVRGIPTALVTGGFKYQADRALREFRITHSFAACEYFWAGDGTLEHWNLLPADFEGKLHFMRMLLHEYQLAGRDCAFVGDGQNDRGLAENVGLSVAFNGAQELREIATHCVNQEPGTEDFGAILPCLGF